MVLDMEDLMREFEVLPKHPSELALRNWRKAVYLVKNRRRRFRHVADLDKRMQMPSRSLKRLELEEILNATHNFSNENLITKGAFGKVYKGQLSWFGNLMNVSIRRLDCEYGQGDELETEISMLKSLEHKNIVSMFAYCDENNEKIIIYGHGISRTLDQHISDSDLTWSQRLQICLGVAHALNHIHYDVMHCDISCSKIFLDDDWEPKIYGFELSTEYPQSWMHRLRFSRYFESNNMIPKYDANNMTPRYDVFAFGVLLLEVLCGGEVTIANGVIQEEPDIDPNLWKQKMDVELLRKLKYLANICLNQQLEERPSMDHIAKELAEVLELQCKIEQDEGTSSNTLKVEFYEIPLRKIKEATNNFDKTCSVGSGGYADVYKAELDVLDTQSNLSTKEENCNELPKIRKTVAIKRIKHKADGHGIQGFITETELLARCKHPNIISLLGFSKENNELILVYEYALNGSLGDYLVNRDKTHGSLTWAQRLQICLDIANGINYLHTNMKGKPRIIHRDIKSDNILMDKNLNAKVADFGLSKFNHMKHKASTIRTQIVAGTEVYVDPEYLTTGNYKRASDIYSFGVVLFEVLCGRLAYDPIYIHENVKGLAPIARRRFTERTLKELMDPKMIEEDGDTFTFNREPNQSSFDTFSKVAYECLAETQAKRPTMEVVIGELQKALNLQGETIVLRRFRLSDIVSATNTYDETYAIGLYTNGTVYRAELDHFGYNGSLLKKVKSNGEPSKKLGTVAIKRFTGRNSRQVKQESFGELEMLATYRHPRIASILGFCDEGDEMILVYEHAYNKSLGDYLKSVDNMNNLTWTHRLHMCLEIAHGLEYFHTNMAKHSDIKSANIVFDKNCQAKIAYFGISKLHSSKQEVSIKVYEGPEYETTGKIEIKSDIYSFGVVLFEIFCGRLAYDPFYIVKNDKGLAPIARLCFKDGTIERMMDPKLKEENNEDIFTSIKGPNQDSLDTYLRIAYHCLGEAAERPTMERVIQELERAFNFQVPI